MNNTKEGVRNPFDITKAVDFTDEQINEFWVQIWENEEDRMKFLDPLSPVPKFILGSKGCGKTHLMRYFSYPLQKIRYDNNVASLIKGDKYIGIYHILNGLNSHRFSGKGVDNEQWDVIFKYYVELVIAEKVLNIISDILINIGIDSYLEKKICHEIMLRFDTYEQSGIIDDFQKLKYFIFELRKKIDYAVNNVALTRSLDIENIKITATSGNLIFGIPKILSENIPDFKQNNIQFLYLWDEFEKLLDSQKKFINTLLWEKDKPSTLWIGARYYGFNVFDTFNEEKIREGSEYEKVDLDHFLRKTSSNYERFLKRLCESRLSKSGLKISSDDLEYSFDKFEEDDFLDSFVKKYAPTQRPYTLTLISQLNSLFLKEPEVIEKIISNLSAEGKPLHEKYNYHLFYQDWAKGKNLLKSSEEIKQEYIKFVQNKTSKRHSNVEQKFKKDLIAQLIKEARERIPYTGLETFIEMAWGHPRSFLNILKHIYKSAIYNGEQPFQKDKISIRSQTEGVLEASQWFYNDAEVTGEKANTLSTIIDNLGNSLRSVRFSDTISETSPSSFYVISSQLTDEAKEGINLVKTHSFIIENEAGRHSKNSDSKEKLYQIHKMLAPKWDLPIIRRGTVKMNTQLLESIFNKNSFKDFTSHLKEFTNKRNGPFFGKKVKPTKNTKNNDQLLLPGIQ
jgi:hypothetical protein